ncbi:MAG: glycosyltransferase family 39 protein [Bacteroidetes bacterium]|nr:glycosyltransferase family 39 protein [Bacteroidota bacterium]
MKYSEQLFGNSEVALRLPNLLLLLVYMFYSYRLFKDQYFLFTSMIFLLLCTNYILMDLFGLARGYGMSCGFMLMSLYHFIEYVKEHKKTDLTLFHFASLLASLSNFTLVIVYVALLLVYNLTIYLHTRLVRDEKFRLMKTNRAHMIPLLIVTVILYEPLRRVITYADLGFGGKSGIYADTLTHLIRNTFYGVNISSSMMVVLKIILTFMLLVSLFIIVKNSVQKRSTFFEQYQGLIILTFLLVILPTIIVFQHLILGSDFPIGRFSIFLFPLWMVHVGFLMQYFMSTGYRNVTLIILSFAALNSVISFCKSSNFYLSAEWSYDSETKNMIQALASDLRMNNDSSKTIKLGISWPFEPTINFYRVTKGLTWLLPVDRNGFNKTDDYFYIFGNELRLLETYEYNIIKEYKSTNTFLVKNKNSR